MMTTKIYKHAFVFLLALNAIYFVLRTNYGPYAKLPWPWLIVIVSSYALVVALLMWRNRVYRLFTAVVIWVSFAHMLILTIGDREVPVHPDFAFSLAYVELAWAAVFCIGSLVLASRLVGAKATA